MKAAPCLLAGLGLASVLAVALAADKPAAPAADDVQEFVFLGEARPVLVRLHVRVDGKPVAAAWDEFVKYEFAYLDVNGDGALDKDEAERVPSADQILGSGVNVRVGGTGGGGRPTAAPSLETLDADKDGKVSVAELGAYYRKNGLAPFQFQLEQPANPLGAAAALFGGQRPDPPVKAVSDAVFALLDTDKDGKLSKEELAAAPAVLLQKDEDEDEIVTPLELVPDAPSPANPFALGEMMAGGGKSGSAAGNKTLTPVPTPGESPANLVRFMQERYGPKSDKPEEKKLSRKDLGLDEATFTRLDADGDGALDAQELAAFVKRPSDLELTVRIGHKETAEAEVELAPGEKSPLAGKVRTKDGVAFLDLGVTRVELRPGESESPDRFAGLLRQQYMIQLKQADTNGDGVIDENEAKNNRLFKTLFKAIDRDGDGKVTEKELIAYLDQARELQLKAQAGCVTLVLTDQSRGLFDLLDADRDGRLGVREMRQAVKLLDRLDPDGRGYITKHDVPKSYRVAVRRGAADLGGNPTNLVAAYFGGYSSETQSAPRAGPAWFRKMDRNRDGDVSRKEFLFSDELFRKLDLDGDGLISADEAERAGDLVPQEKK